MTDRADRILKIIESNPGIHFRGIMHKTGFMNGVLSHHLAKLEGSNRIVAERAPRTTRFYPNGIPESDFVVIRALRRPTPRALLLALLHDDGLSFVQLVARSGRSPSTVSLYLAQLVRDGLVRIRTIDLKKRYYLTDRGAVDRLLDVCGPGLLDKYAANFEDLINPLNFSASRTPRTASSPHAVTSGF